ESKWQAYWQKNKLFEAADFDKKPKNYILVEFPYPSGEGLHTGHCRSYTALDIIARKRRMQGFNVLFPIGWDAFGLPTENYAIKTGIHPSVATKKNTDTFRRQLKSLGFSFDWSREINTTDPKYYKWTQWIFLQLYKKGLAYKAKMPINFCPACKIGLANEEVVKGKCERCGAIVRKKEMTQWMLKITKYADRLIDDLEKVDYQEKIKKQQINWIGRSEGAEIKFKITQLPNYSITIFTTRPDTLSGATYMVASPEHSLIKNLSARGGSALGGKSKIKNYKEVNNYINQARQKSDIERTDEKKEKTGVELKGIKAINPANNKKIPVFVADYVLPHYGTGAIMAVPAHDERDSEFAQKFHLPVIKVKFPKDAIKKMISWLEKNKIGKYAVNYKLRDWVFSRQHYWGEPIPMVFCSACKKRIGNLKSKIPNPKQAQNSKFKIQNYEYNQGEIINPGWIAVEEKDLPVELPMVEKYQPTETGESPLANIKDWVNTKCPKCDGPAKRETDTMPNWAGSSWYYLRYLDPNNDKELADRKKIDYFMPVDWYNGGMEHTTLHLLYSRFWYKFLFDLGVVPTDEPYQKRTSQGMVLGEGGIKMSKSKNNVVNPDDIVKQYGADTLRLYEMFIGPFGERVAWDTKGILGVKRFLDKVWRLFSPRHDREPSRQLLVKLNQTIKKVTDDIESMSFNTAVSSMMELVNEAAAAKVSSAKIKDFLLILSPFAPHICEELWEEIGGRGLILEQKWPKADKKYLLEKEITIAIQVNGKLRDTIRVKSGASEKKIIELSKKAKNAKKYLVGKKIKKEIYIKDKLINFVI
ncbi:MAG: leucyl-tRNA synthetase, partial [Candidatus Berkelbacteria bacterium Licking1014_96]